MAIDTSLSPTAAVTALASPVNIGAARFAFSANAVCVAVEIGLSKSVVLSTLPKPTIADVIPVTVHVNVGDAKGAAPDTSATGMAALAVIVEVPFPFT